MLLSKKKEQLQKRAKYLIDNQAHEFDWTCQYDEFEYFSLKVLFEDKYCEKDDSLEDNFYLNLPINKVLDVLDLMKLILQTATLIDIQKLLIREIANYTKDEHQDLGDVSILDIVHSTWNLFHREMDNIEYQLLLELLTNVLTYTDETNEYIEEELTLDDVVQIVEHRIEKILK